MTNAISQNVLEEILKAYAAGERLPNPQAIHQLAGASATSPATYLEPDARGSSRRPPRSVLLIRALPQPPMGL